jgi:hypothetical protein
MIQLLLDFRAFFSGKLAVGFGARLSCADASLLFFEFSDFLSGEFAAPGSLPNSQLLAMFASVDGIATGKKVRRRQDCRAHNGSE